jgi:hypothetical protein
MFSYDKIFVTVGAGRKVPLPIPGGGSVSGLGNFINRTMEVERLLANGDLVLGKPPAPEPAAPTPAAPPAPEPAAAPAATDTAKAK